MFKGKSQFVCSQIRRYCLQPKKEKSYPKRIFSGIQPTGAVHLGNYLGAITNWVQLQNSNVDIMLSIVDLHSITLPQNPKELSRNILEMTATLLACGIDPNKTILFQQSLVHQHTELCWILGCVCTMARLAHLPQFKEKSQNLKDVPLGLFIYPVLQAADILLYKSTEVPVGEDQLQHLQLTQELARMFNSRFGETFPIPHAIVAEVGNARLRSLRNPEKKMSKSDTDSKGRINLSDSEDDIIKKIRKAVSDFTSSVSYEPEARPGVSNLVAIHSALSGKSIGTIVEEVKDLDTLGYKQLVGEEVATHLRPIRENIQRYMAEPQYLIDILQNGADRASEIGERTVTEVRRKVGITCTVKTKKSKAKVELSQ